MQQATSSKAAEERPRNEGESAGEGSWGFEML